MPSLQSSHLNCVIYNVALSLTILTSVQLTVPVTAVVWQKHPLIIYIRTDQYKHPCYQCKQFLVSHPSLRCVSCFRTGVIKPSLAQSLSLHSHPLLRLISWNLTTRCLAVTGGGRVGECGRLSQLAFGSTTCYTHVYCSIAAKGWMEEYTIHKIRT